MTIRRLRSLRGPNVWAGCPVLEATLDLSDGSTQDVRRTLERLRADLRKMGDFKRIHPMPSTSADVPDDLDARLVILGVDHAYIKEPDNAAERAASYRENVAGFPRRRAAWRAMTVARRGAGDH